MSARTLGSAVERERLALGLTQQELSARSGVSLATIGAIERNERDRFSPRVLADLSTALGVSPSWASALLASDEANDDVDAARRTLLVSLARRLPPEAVEHLVAEGLRRDGSQHLHIRGEVVERAVWPDNGMRVLLARLNDEDREGMWVVRMQTPDPDKAPERGDEIVLELTYER